MSMEAYSITSEDGEEYALSPFEGSIENMERLWETTQKHEVLTSDQTRGDFQTFMAYVLSPGTIFQMVTHLGEEPEDVGVFYADSISPKHSASAHFVFWDLKLAGRQRLILTAARSFMEDFELQRLDIEVPMHAYAALKRLKKMGIALEGRRRGAYLRDGVWTDTLLFGILKDELDDEAIKEGKIPRKGAEGEWFGLLEHDEHLARRFLKDRS